VVLVGGDETCRATTRDIGEGGMALGGVPAGWTTGSKIQIRCEGGLLRQPLTAEAVIAWRRQDVAGVSFSGLEPELAPVVAAYVAGSGKLRP